MKGKRTTPPLRFQKLRCLQFLTSLPGQWVFTAAKYMSNECSDKKVGFENSVEIHLRANTPDL